MLSRSYLVHELVVVGIGVLRRHFGVGAQGDTDRGRHRDANVEILFQRPEVKFVWRRWSGAW